MFCRVVLKSAQCLDRLKSKCRRSELTFLPVGIRTLNSCAMGSNYAYLPFLLIAIV
jgi:hypothetical protein